MHTIVKEIMKRVRMLLAERSYKN